jgi:hypothetical protein
MGLNFRIEVAQPKPQSQFQNVRPRLASISATYLPTSATVVTNEAPNLTGRRVRRRSMSAAQSAAASLRLTVGITTQPVITPASRMTTPGAGTA